MEQFQPAGAAELQTMFSAVDRQTIGDLVCVYELVERAVRIGPKRRVTGDRQIGEAAQLRSLERKGDSILAVHVRVRIERTSLAEVARKPGPRFVNDVRAEDMSPSRRGLPLPRHRRPSGSGSAAKWQAEEAVGRVRLVGVADVAEDGILVRANPVYAAQES